MRLIAALFVLSAAAHAEMPVRYVLAQGVTLVDPAPDARFDAKSIANGEFRSRFEAAFPGQVIELGPDRMISPDERVIVILPRITAVRVAHMVQAGSVHSFDTIIVGDVSALDPWTGANLYSATRMVSGKIQLGQSALSEGDAKIREGFRDTYSRWMAAALEETREKLAPFVLDSGTIMVPDQMRKSPGGIWPFGSARGLRLGATLSGTIGHFARVTHVAGRFSTIEDVSDPKRQIPQGERYTLTVVQKPTERPEPRVALSWAGLPPAIPESQIQVLDPDAMLGLFSDYISKSGGLKLLPLDLAGATARGEVQKLKEQVARFSKLASNGVMTLHAETLVQAALEAPEYRVEVGVVERYHGLRTGANQSIEHYYRVTLAAAAYGRCGSEESAQYPLQRIIQHSEELAEITRDGVREIDPADAWFTVTRNAVIHLSEKIVKELTTQAPGTESGWRHGSVQPDRSIVWESGAPPAGAPIEWLRPSGEVRAASGEVLGKFERPMAPSQGYLNAQVLQREKLEPGDALRYQATAVLPVVGLAIETMAPAPDWMIEPAWLLKLAADGLSHALGFRIVPLEQAASGRVERMLILNVAALKADTSQDGALFSGQWRLRLVDASVGASANPRFKMGVQTDARVDKESSAPSLKPPDVSGWALKYVADSMTKLAAAASTKGVNAAVTAASSEATHN